MNTNNYDNKSNNNDTSVNNDKVENEKDEVNNNGLARNSASNDSLKEHLKLKNYDKRKISSAYALITQMAIQVMVIMVAMFFLGKWIDEKLGTSPLFLLLMLLLGMASAFKSIYDMGMNQVKKFEKHDKFYNSYKKYNYEDEDNDENSDF